MSAKPRCRSEGELPTAGGEANDCLLGTALSLINICKCGLPNTSWGTDEFLLLRNVKGVLKQYNAAKRTGVVSTLDRYGREVNITASISGGVATKQKCIDSVGKEVSFDLVGTAHGLSARDVALLGASATRKIKHPEIDEVVPQLSLLCSQMGGSSDLFRMLGNFLEETFGRDKNKRTDMAIGKKMLELELFIRETGFDLYGDVARNFRTHPYRDTTGTSSSKKADCEGGKEDEKDEKVGKTVIVMLSDTEDVEELDEEPKPGNPLPKRRRRKKRARGQKKDVQSPVTPNRIKNDREVAGKTVMVMLSDGEEGDGFAQATGKPTNADVKYSDRKGPRPFFGNEVSVIPDVRKERKEEGTPV